MIRLIIDIDEQGDKLATKEAVAMDLEKYGRVRVVKVISADSRGREKKQ